MASLADAADDPTLPDMQVRRDALRRQETRVKFVRAAIVSVFFAVVMGANLYVGAVVVIGKLSSQSDDAKIPVTRIGRVSHTLLDGTFCRTMTYDNTLGQTTSDKIVPCDELKSRRRGNTMLNWSRE